MHVFVTGATGWVGARVVLDLISHGHRVTALARSAAKAAPASAAGAAVIEGSLDDADRLRDAARGADAVVHTAFDHDWSRFAASAELDARAIAAMGEALAGTEKPMLVTSGLGFVAAGPLATEVDAADPRSPRKSERAAAEQRARGVRIAVVRLAPSVHGPGERHGFVPILADLARRTGVSAYLGSGEDRWAGVFRDDAAAVYRLALEDGLSLPAYHAVADEGVPVRRIAAAVGRQLGLPVESRPAEHFGWFARMAGAELSASSALTRATLGWSPAGPDLLSDIDRAEYHDLR